MLSELRMDAFSMRIPVSRSTADMILAIAGVMNSGGNELAQNQRVFRSASSMTGWIIRISTRSSIHQRIEAIDMSRGRKRNDSSPVVDAVRSRSVQTLAAVLDSGASPDTPEEGGFAPLMEAVVTGQSDMVDLLIERGANVNATDAEGWTAIHFAAQENLLHIARSLITAGAHVDALDVHGNTPLWRATFGGNGSEQLLRLLLDNGADPHHPNNHGVAPRDLAATGQPYVRQVFGLNST
jgi:uncharacterized protein